MKNIKFKDFDDNEYDISEYDMKRLALFNLTLKPISEVTEIVGYLGALDNYYMANDDELKTVYDAVKLSYFGKKYYANLLEMFILDQMIQDREIKIEDVSERYNNLVENQDKILNILNSNELENEVKMRK